MENIAFKGFTPNTFQFFKDLKINNNKEMRPHHAISRIYRDTRFSKDKSPYKTFMWMTFQLPISSEE